MPSALETLVKILKLEREQGCKNTAVIGGLAAFSEKWSLDAHAQARKPEHHLLVDELSGLLRQYEAADNRADRLKSVTYMLDRIMGRVPPPPEYQAPEPPPFPAGAESSAVPDVPLAEPSGRMEERRPPARPQPPSGEDRRSRPPAPPVREHRSSAEDDEENGPEIRETDSSSDEYGFDRYDSPSRSRRGRPMTSTPDLDVPTPVRLARVPRRPRRQVSAEEADDIMRGLKAPITVLKGVGPSTAEQLEKLGITTVEDLLNYLPRRYDDYTRLRTIRQLTAAGDEPITVIGSVVRTEVRIGKGGRKDFYMLIDDGSARLGVLFFGQHFLVRSIRAGEQLVLSGPVAVFGHQLQMNNPEWEVLDAENLHTIGIVPVYGLTEGLSGRTLRKLMRSAVNYWSERVIDHVPEGTLERTELADLGWMLREIHFPEGWDHLEHARRRFIFDELLTLQLAMLGNRREWQSVPAWSLEVSDEFLESFTQAVFPYPLTGAQRRAIDDIRHDVRASLPMNRLLQGDVGSGKTAVAIVALAMAFSCAKQGAIMVPTGILAEQHHRNLTAAFEQMPGERRPVIALLTSALSATERESIYRGISDGSIDIVVGTHALIQEGVTFSNLALVVIDEQHRFGVEQRRALRGKGTNPHLLVMTATPIPRTMALTVYADLDLTILNEMPPGRTPVQTRIVRPVERERVYNFVEAQLKQGRQAFIVHPLVEASDRIEAPAAVEAYERLQRVFFRHKVALLHGRMRSDEKDEVMAAFGAGRFDVLVTTSVAEVGVNVPNATVMVIEGANRFGLAQLHQFRGRVGRGEHASYCLLVSDTASEEANERLKIMEETTDGFKLAEMDWRLRGAGDLIGVRQSGGNRLQLAEQMTPELVELAQREARTIYEVDPALSQDQHHLLAQRVGILHNERSDVS